jgi:hypothetical protein
MSLVGLGFGFLWALEIIIKLHHGIKLLELLVVNYDSALGGIKRQISDPDFKVVDLVLSSRGATLNSASVAC